MAKSATEEVEYQESQTKKGQDLEQDALYQAYILKSPEWHQEMTRKLMRKIDLHLLPFLVLMYLLNFLDRKCVIGSPTLKIILVLIRIPLAICPRLV